MKSTLLTAEEMAELLDAGEMAILLGGDYDPIEAVSWLNGNRPIQISVIGGKVTIPTVPLLRSDHQATLQRHCQAM